MRQVIETLDERALRGAFATFPTGVVAVAAQIDGGTVGLAASSFTSVSLDPPLASFAVAKNSATWPLLRRVRRIGVTVLAENQGAVCRRLAGPAGERFVGIAVEVVGEDAVMLIDGSADFQCSVRDEVDAGDHLIVLLNLHAASINGTMRPLIFHGSTFARLAQVSGSE